MADHIDAQNILIVGGCGNFGFRVVRWLLSEVQLLPSHIAVMDIVDPSSDRALLGVTYYKTDITDKAAVTEAISAFKPGVIIHTASPPPLTSSLEVLMRGNVEGTRTLLAVAVAETPVKVFVYTSSSSVVHDYYSDLVEADETWPVLFMPQQRMPYHHSKATAEKLALSYNRKREDFVVAALRPSGIFGPDDRSTIQALVERAKAGSLRVQIGDGKNEADFTYTDNIVHAHVLAVEKLLQAVSLGSGAVDEDMRVEGEAFTITNDEHPKFWEFARKVGAVAGYPTDVKRVVSIPKFLGLTIASLVEWWVWLTSFGQKQAKVRRLELNYSTITRTFNIQSEETTWISPAVYH